MTGPGVFMLVFIAVLVLWAIAAVVGGSRKRAALVAAQKAYRDSLDRLRSTPGDPTLRQKSLALGRAYASLSRDSKGVALFDEVALMNDINAACAATNVSVGGETSTQAAPPKQTDTVEARLERLKSLRDRGVIDEDEYRMRRGRDTSGRVTPGLGFRLRVHHRPSFWALSRPGAARSVRQSVSAQRRVLARCAGGVLGEARNSQQQPTGTALKLWQPRHARRESLAAQLTHGLLRGDVPIFPPSSQRAAF